MKNTHLGDLFYYQSTGVAYRFSIISTVYQWVEIIDSAIGDALALASESRIPVPKPLILSKKKMLGNQVLIKIIPQQKRNNLRPIKIVRQLITSQLLLPLFHH